MTALLLQKEVEEKFPARFAGIYRRLRRFCSRVPMQCNDGEEELATPLKREVGRIHLTKTNAMRLGGWQLARFLHWDSGSCPVIVARRHNRGGAAEGSEFSEQSCF